MKNIVFCFVLRNTDLNKYLFTYIRDIDGGINIPEGKMTNKEKSNYTKEEQTYVKVFRVFKICDQN